MMTSRILTLPWPPSVNHYWRSIGPGRVIVSKAGRLYRDLVYSLLAEQPLPPFSGRLAVDIMAHVPDRRRRDLDNIHKAVLDAMKHAGVYEDDSQIDDLRIRRAEIVPGGRLCVVVTEIEP